MTLLSVDTPTVGVTLAWNYAYPNTHTHTHTQSMSFDYQADALTTPGYDTLLAHMHTAHQGELATIQILEPMYTLTS